MALLDNYLNAVNGQLPKAQQDDITAELRDILLSQIEARESECGRPVTDDETAAILKRFGHPLTVAARYGSRGYLIGPTIFPFYRALLKVMLTRVLLPALLFVLIVPALVADDPLVRVPFALWILATVMLAGFGVITLVFARLERLGTPSALIDNWDPHSLPAPHHPQQPAPRSEAVVSLVMVGFYLLWWIDVLPLANVNRWFGGAPLGVTPGPIWGMLNPAIVALMLGSIACDVVAIARPAWTTLQVWASLVLHGASALLLYRLIAADSLLVEVRTGLRSPFEYGMRIALVVMAVIVVISLASRVRGLFAHARRRPDGTIPVIS
jgi:hypothetical protein